MIDFFFRKKPIHVDAFTFLAGVHHFSPIVRASKAVPEWFLKSKKTHSLGKKALPPEAPTIKSCWGLRELYSHGLVVRSPMEMNIGVAYGEITGHSYVEATPGLSNDALFQKHDDDMFGEFLNQAQYWSYRINLPWMFYTKESINWTLAEPFWSGIDNRYRIAMGNINFRYFHNISVHMLFNRISEPFKVNIPFNQPLYHILPHSDRPIKIHNHLVDEIGRAHV